jgi:hypothetical protein
MPLPPETPMARLLHALRAAGLDDDAQIEEGPGGVASPSRLATEWSGYRVNGPGGAYYAKVLHDDMRELLDLRQCAQASRSAGLSGAAPELIASDLAGGVLLFEALPPAEWRPARLDDVLAPGRLHALWALKRQVHAGPAVDFDRSPMVAIERLRALCRRDQVTLPAEYPWLDQCVEMAWDALRTRSFEPVPGHGDGVVSNVMIHDDGQLKLIDFDHGGGMDPWYDVAITLNELYPFESQWREGIQAWAGACRESDYALCRLYALLDDWHWTLWGLWTGATSRRPLEFSKLGQWNLLRCRHSAQDPRLESWLRQVQGEAL